MWRHLKLWPHQDLRVRLGWLRAGFPLGVFAALGEGQETENLGCAWKRTITHTQGLLHWAEKTRNQRCRYPDEGHTNTKPNTCPVFYWTYLTNWKLPGRGERKARQEDTKIQEFRETHVLRKHRSDLRAFQEEEWTQNVELKRLRNQEYNKPKAESFDEPWLGLSLFARREGES